MGVIANLMQTIVLAPSVATVLALFITSLINELFGIIPYTVLLSGQMFFLGVPLSGALLSKIFIFVALPVGVGTAIGSLLIYALAYWGGKPAIEKFGRHFRLSWENVEKVQIRFKGSWYDDVAFLALRSVPFMPGLPISAAAGILRMPTASYVAITALGATIKVIIMCVIVGVGIGAVAI